LKVNTYFVVVSKFIDELMMGIFPKSKIILAGCETTEDSHLAESLLYRGASEVVGWDGLVSSRQNDEVIMQVLEKTLVNGIELKDAVELVMKQYDQKLRTDTALSHYSTGAWFSKIPARHLVKNDSVIISLNYFEIWEKELSNLYYNMHNRLIPNSCTSGNEH